MINTFTPNALYLPKRFTDDKYEVNIAVTAAKIVALSAISILINSSLSIFGTYAKSGFIIPLASTFNCFNPMKNLSCEILMKLVTYRILPIITSGIPNFTTFLLRINFSKVNCEVFCKFLK